MNIVERKGQKSNLIRFIHSDNKEWMKQIDWHYYHLGIVDPPYGIDVTKMNLGKTKAQLKKIAATRDKTAWDGKTPDAEYYELLFYVTRQQVIWGANYFMEFLGNCQKYYLWDKQQAEELSFADCEFAWTSYEGAPKMIRRHRRRDQDHKKIHDTQKPVYLYDAIFADLFERELLKKGDRILDTHGGSHNITIAAWKYHLNVDIIEVNEEYHLAGIKNFDLHCSQLRAELF